MEKLLQILLEETEREERRLWYTPGYEAEERALHALSEVLTAALARIKEEN